MRRLKYSFFAVWCWVSVFSANIAPAGAANVSQYKIPHEIGEITSSSETDSEKTIIHIQDAHCVNEAQENIIRILGELISVYNVQLVTTEGASGDISPSEFMFPDAKIRKNVSTYFLNKGKITGAEFLLINNDYKFTLRGADDKDYYTDNFNSFVHSIQSREKALEILDSTDATFNKLAEKLLSDKSRGFFSKIIEYRQENISFVEFCETLADYAREYGADLSSYRQFALLYKAVSLEKKINFDKIAAEQAKLIDSISRLIPEKQLNELLNKNLMYKLQKISPAQYFSYIENLVHAHDNEISLADYDNLSIYITYLRIYRKINFSDLAKEVPDIEDTVKRAVFKKESELRLCEISESVIKLKRFFALRLTPGEVDRIREKKEAFSASLAAQYLEKTCKSTNTPQNIDHSRFQWIDSQIPFIENFFHVAKFRDKILVENTLAEMELEGQNLAVLICGGFHTKGIEAQLRRRGVSFITVIPRVSKATANEGYLQLMTGAKTPFESMIGKFNGYLAYQSLLASTPMVDPQAKLIFSTGYKIQSLIQLADSVLTADTGLQVQLAQNPALAKSAFFHALNTRLGDYSSKLNNMELKDIAVLKNGERYYKLALNGSEMAFRVTSTRETQTSIALGDRIKSDLDSIFENFVTEKTGVIGSTEVALIDARGFDEAVSYAVSRDIIGSFKLEGISKTDFSKQARILSGIYTAVKTNQQYIAVSVLADSIEEINAVVNFLKSIDSTTTIDDKTGLIPLTAKIKFVSSLYSTAGNIRKISETPGFAQLSSAAHPAWADKQVYIEKDLVFQTPAGNLDISAVGRSIPAICALADALAKPPADTDVLNYEIDPIEGTDCVKVVLKAPAVRPKRIEDFHPGITAIKEKVDEFSPVKINGISVGKAVIAINTLTGSVSLLKSDPAVDSKKEIMKVSDDFIASFLKTVSASRTQQQDKTKIDSFSAQIKSNRAALIRFFAVYPSEFTNFIAQLEKTARNYSAGNTPEPYIIDSVMLDYGQGFNTPVDCGIVKRDPLSALKPLQPENPESREVFDEISTAVNNLPLSETTGLTADTLYSELRKVLGESNVNCAAYALLAATKGVPEELASYMTPDKKKELSGFNPLKLTAAIVYAIDKIYRGTDHSQMVSEEGFVQSSMFSVAKAAQIMSNIVSGMPGKIEPAGYDLGNDNQKILKGVFNLIESGNSMILIVNTHQGIAHYIYLAAAGAGKVYLKDPMSAQDAQGLITIDDFLKNYAGRLTGKIIVFEPWADTGDAVLLSNEEMIGEGAAMGPISSFGMARGPAIGNTAMPGAFGHSAGLKFAFESFDVSGWGYSGDGDDDPLKIDMNRFQAALFDKFGKNNVTVNRIADKNDNDIIVLNLNLPYLPYGETGRKTLDLSMREVFAKLFPGEGFDIDIDNSSGKSAVKVKRVKKAPLRAERKTRQRRKVLIEIPDYTPVVIHPYDLSNFKHAPKNAYEYLGAKRAVPGSGSDVSINLAFKGDLVSNDLFLNILKNKYGENFLYGYDAEITAKLILYLSKTVDQDGNISFATGEQALQRLFRLIDTVETLNALAGILTDQTTYSELFRQKLTRILTDTGIEPESLINTHNDHFKNFDSSRKYPQATVEFIYKALDNPAQTLDDNFITDFFTNNRFFSISQTVKSRLELRQALTSLTAKYPSISGNMDKFISWYTEGQPPAELEPTPLTYRELKLKETIENTAKTYPSAVEDILAIARQTAKSDKSSRDKIISDFMDIIAQSETALSYLNSPESASAISLNLVTAQDNHEYIAARFSPRSDTFYTVIGKGSLFFGQDMESAAQFSASVTSKTASLKDKKGSPLLNVLSQEVYAVESGDYEIIWADKSELEGKSAEDTALALNVLNALSGELKPANARVFNTISPQPADKTIDNLSAAELKTAAAQTAYFTAIESITNIENGVYKIDETIFTTDFNNMQNATIYALAQGPAYHTLCTAVNEAQIKGLRLADYIFDASSARQAFSGKDSLAGSIVLAISTSGEDYQTIQALEESLKLGAKTVLITSKEGSRAYNTAKKYGATVIVIPPESSGSMGEGSGIAQLAVLRVMALYFSYKSNIIDAQKTDSEIKNLAALDIDGTGPLEKTARIAVLNTKEFRANMDALISRLASAGQPAGPNDNGEIYRSFDSANVFVVASGNRTLSQPSAQGFADKIAAGAKIPAVCMDTVVFANQTAKEPGTISIPDADSRINTISAMIARYAPEGSLSITPDSLNLNSADMKNAKNIVVFCNAEDTFIADYIENKYRFADTIHIHSRFYSDSVTGVSPDTIVVALNPQTDAEFQVATESAGKGAKIIISGQPDIKDRAQALQAGFFELAGPDISTSSQIGTDLILMMILNNKGEPEFSAQNISAELAKIKGSIQSLRDIAGSFADGSSENSVNLARLIELIRKTGWNALSGSVTGDTQSMAAAKDLSTKLTFATGNPIPVWNLYSPSRKNTIRPGGVSWFYMPAKGSVDYPDFEQAVKDTAIRQSAVYPLFSGNITPAGITAVIAAKDNKNGFISHMTDNNYAALNSNLRAGLAEYARPQIVFTTPQGSAIETQFINEIITASVYYALSEDKKVSASNAGKSAPKTVIEIKFPGATEYQEKYQSEMIRKFKDANPDAFIISIILQNAQPSDYADSTINIPSSDITAMISMLDFMVLRLIQQRFAFPASEMINLMNKIYNLDKTLSAPQTVGILERYLRNDSGAGAVMLPALEKTDYLNESSWKHINKLLEYLIYRVNIYPPSIITAVDPQAVRRSVIDSAVWGAFEPAEKPPARFSFGSDFKPAQKMPADIYAGKSAVINTLKNRVAGISAQDILKKMADGEIGNAKIQSAAKSIAGSAKPAVEKQFEAIRLYLDKIEPISSQMTYIIRNSGNPETVLKLDNVLSSKSPAQDIVSSIANLFYANIVEPGLRQVQDIIAGRYAGIDRISIALRFDSYNPPENANTAVIDAGAFLSPLLTLAQLDSQMLAVMFEPLVFATIRDDFIAEGKSPQIASERTQNLIGHFIRFMTLNSETAIIESASPQLFDQAQTTLANPDSRISHAQTLSDIIFDYNRKLQAISDNRSLTDTQKANMADSARFEVVREHINGNLYSVNETFLKNAYSKITAQIKSVTGTDNAHIALTFDEQNGIIALTASPDTSDDILNDKNTQTPQPVLPAVNLINFDLISAPDKTDLLTDSDSLNVKDKILELKTASKGPVVIYSWNRTPEDMALRLSFFGLTVEKGLNGSTGADVIIVGSEDLRTFRPDRFADPNAEGVSPAQTASNINLVLDIVSNVIFKDKLLPVADKDKPARMDIFNLIESDAGVIQIALDLGLKIGVSRNSASASISFDDIETGTKMEIGGDRIDFLKTMGPDAIVDPETVILEVSSAIRPDLHEWFEKISLLKKIDGYLAVLSELKEKEEIEKNQYNDRLVSARKEIIAAQSKADLDKTEKGIAILFSQLDSWFGKVLSVDRIDQLRSSMQVKVKDMRDGFLGVKFVIGSEMAGVAVSIPQREVEYNIREQLRITREFDKAA